jgi:hypothetical protein
MSTYYEVLKIPSDAPLQMVESAIDTQYNQWRRLVTHHDPSVAEQANHALRTLEMIRNTLCNALERAKYDASLNIGGLADPAELLRNVPPDPAPQRSMNPFAAPMANDFSGQTGRAGQFDAQTVAPLDRVDAWVCARCKNPNPIGEKFCSRCGNQIADACPSCAVLTEQTKPFCSKCGADKAAVIDRQKQEMIRGFNLSIQQLQVEIQEIERLVEKIPFRNFDFQNPILHQEIWGKTGSGCMGSIGIWVILIISCGLAYVTANSTNLTLGVVLFFVIIIIGAIAGTFLEKIFMQNTTVRPRAGKMVEERQKKIAALQQLIREV